MLSFELSSSHIDMAVCSKIIRTLELPINQLKNYHFKFEITILIGSKNTITEFDVVFDRPITFRFTCMKTRTFFFTWLLMNDQRTSIFWLRSQTM